MVSLPLIKIYEFSPLDYSPGSRKKNIFSSGCQLGQHLLSKVLPDQSDTPAAGLLQQETFDHSRCCYFFLLDEWGVYNRCFHCFVAANVNTETQPTSGLLSANLSGSSRTCSPCSLRAQGLIGSCISLFNHLLVPQMWLLYKFCKNTLWKSV